MTGRAGEWYAGEWYYYAAVLVLPAGLMTTVSLKLPDRLAVRLAATARQESMSKSALIRDALESYLRSNEAVRKDSALSRAADVRGMLSGPKDLSVNKKYLQNYGR